MTRKIILSILLLAAGASLAWASMRFDHRAHLEEYIPGTPCSDCHLPGSPSIVPDKKVCLDCHDEDLAGEVGLGRIRTHGPAWALNHGSEARSKAMDCSACHQQSFCLDCHKAGFADEQGEFGNNMINVHRSDFHVTHPIAARTDQRLCASCHEPRFCQDCHSDFRNRIGRASGPSHRRVFGLGIDTDLNAISAIHAGFDATTNCDQCHQQGTVAPDFHQWQIGHAREARRNLATCQACHPGGDICLRCHSAKEGAGRFNPHGKNWSDRDGRLKKASGGKTCRLCHDPVP